MECRRIAYVSFDSVPAPKGAATHIEAFARALGRHFGEVELVTVGSSERIERWPAVFHTELPAIGETLIDRVLYFRRFLGHWLATRRFEAIQFRSIFEGLPLLGRARLIFEVNGLPSIELKYRYPGVEDDRELMRKIVAQEQDCLAAADLIVTPSGVTREYLITKRGVPERKIRVIPNGVHVEMWSGAPALIHGVFRLLYFGTLASWQGVELGIRALAQVRSDVAASFTIIGATSNRESEALMGLAAKLGIGDSVSVLPSTTQVDLAGQVRAANAVLAPLALNDRNVVQGCCPLKILEGMAAGVPVIASDLSVVRELGCDGEHLVLVKAGSVDQIANAVLRLARDPEFASKIGRQARAHVMEHYTWERAGEALCRAHEELGISRVSMA